MPETVSLDAPEDEAAKSDAAARSVLAHQVRALFDDIDEAGQALSAVPGGAELRARVEVNFQDRLDRQRDACLELGERVAAGAPLADCWNEMRELRRDISPLVVECLSFIQGGLAREHGLAVRVTELADGLVRALVSRLPVEWARFTLVSDREYVGGPAEIIRIRFPETTLWSLPLVAHELGHFVGPRLGHDLPDGRYVMPFRDMLLAADARGPGARGRLDEVFADVFGAWTAGPAFVMACLFLRFDPARGSDSPLARHPDDVQRAYVILRTLRSGSPAWPAEFVDELESKWAAVVARAGNARAMSAAVRASLDARTDELIGVLKGEMPWAARYAGWIEAEALALELDAGHVPIKPPPEAGPWDVLNAAWRHRIRAPLRADRTLEGLAERMQGLCLQTLPEGVRA